MKINQKIREALGPELSKQVEAVDSDLELAVMNDGSVVPSSKHEALKLDLKKEQENANGFETQLDTLKKSAGDNEELTKQIDTLKNTLEAERKATAEKDKRRNLVEKAKAQVAMEFNPKYADLIISKVNLDDCAIEGGHVLGLATQLESLKTTYPEFTNRKEAKGHGTTDTTHVKDGDTAKSNPFAKETFNLTEQGRLYRDDRDEYNRLKALAGK